MTKKAVFFHCWIPPDERALFWYYWLDFTMERLVSSGLAYEADINVFVSMPEYWGTDSRAMPFKLKGNNVVFREKVEDYIMHKYPFVSTLEFRDSGLENLYEGYTLGAISEWVKFNPKNHVLYVHSKGISSASPDVKEWSNVVHHHLIDKWRTTESYLNDYDVVACREERDLNRLIVSANMFWATSEYISSLPHPENLQLLNQEHTRYRYERWILSGAEPKIKTAHLIAGDPFEEYITT